MTRYEYQVLEADSPTVPAEMLNQQGEEGWRLAGIVTRDSRPPEQGDSRWVFYFVRELNEGETASTEIPDQAVPEAPAKVEGVKRGGGAVVEE